MHTNFQNILKDVKGMPMMMQASAYLAKGSPNLFRTFKTHLSTDEYETDWSV
jgi:hypothetical protein